MTAPRNDRRQLKLTLAKTEPSTHDNTVMPIDHSQYTMEEARANPELFCNYF